MAIRVEVWQPANDATGREQQRALDLIAEADSSDPFAVARLRNYFAHDRPACFKDDLGHEHDNSPYDNAKKIADSALHRTNERRVTILKDYAETCRRYGIEPIGGV